MIMLPDGSLAWENNELSQRAQNVWVFAIKVYTHLHYPVSEKSLSLANTKYVMYGKKSAQHLNLIYKGYHAYRGLSYISFIA